MPRSRLELPRSRLTGTFFVRIKKVNPLCRVTRLHINSSVHEWLEQTQVDLVRNGNNIRFVETANEAELIRSAIRDHLARRQ